MFCDNPGGYFTYPLRICSGADAANESQPADSRVQLVRQSLDPSDLQVPVGIAAFQQIIHGDLVHFREIQQQVYGAALLAALEIGVMDLTDIQLLRSLFLCEMSFFSEFL